MPILCWLLKFHYKHADEEATFWALGASPRNKDMKIALTRAMHMQGLCNFCIDCSNSTTSALTRRLRFGHWKQALVKVSKIVYMGMYVGFMPFLLTAQIPLRARWRGGYTLEASPCKRCVKLHWYVECTQGSCPFICWLLKFHNERAREEAMFLGSGSKPRKEEAMFLGSGSKPRKNVRKLHWHVWHVRKVHAHFSSCSNSTTSALMRRLRFVRWKQALVHGM